MATDEPLERVEKALRLLAAVALEGRKQRDQVRLLSRAGYGPSEIAELLGSTAKSISVRLAEMRKDGRSRQKRNGR